MSEKFIEKYKSEILITTGFFAIASLLGGIYYIKNNKPAPALQEDYVSYKMPDNIMTVTKDGLVNLYNNQSELIKSVDLRDYLGVPLEEIKPEPASEPTSEPTFNPEPAPKEEVIETPKLYEDFVVVQVTIQDKDISWNIQSKLTPNRKIEDMIALDEQLNKDSVLHPIYPGDTRLYLKEKDCTENILGETVVMDARESELISNDAVMSITKTEEETPPKEEIQEEQTINTDTIDYKYTDVNFIYSTSSDISKILVYNDFNNTFMEVSVENEEINVTPILKTDKYYNIDDFKIENDIVYAISKIDKTIYKFTKDISNTITKFVNYNIKDWALYDDKVYLISEDTEKLEMLDMSKEEHDDDVYTLNLGDKSMGLEIVDNNLYVLNNFGSQNNNNVVHKFNPENLASEGWVELEDINNTLIKSASTEKIVLLEKNSLSSNKKEATETLVAIKEDNKKKLVKDEMNIDGLKAEDTIVKENLFYEKDNENINLKSVSRLDNVATINIEDGTVFVPVFKN